MYYFVIINPVIQRDLRAFCFFMLLTETLCTVWIELSFILKDHFQDLSLIYLVTYDCENHIFQLFIV